MRKQDSVEMVVLVLERAGGVSANLERLVSAIPVVARDRNLQMPGHRPSHDSGTDRHPS